MTIADTFSCFFARQDGNDLSLLRLQCNDNAIGILPVMTQNNNELPLLCCSMAQRYTARRRVYLECCHWEQLLMWVPHRKSSSLLDGDVLY